MSQSGYTPILIYASGTTTNVPSASNLTSSSAGAELALNYADGKLFYKDSGGVVQVLATKASAAISLPLTTANGGTGVTTAPTAGSVVWGATTSTLGYTAAGTSGQVLVSGGAGTPTWTTNIAGNAANVTGTVAVGNGGTGITTTPSNGFIPIGNGTNYTAAAITGTTNQITVTNASGSITLSTPQAINTAASVQFGSFGVGTAASGTTGEIRATNNVTAFYSSDIKFKENVRDIPNALATVNAIGGKLFDWTDAYIESRGGVDDYFVQKADFGVIAQDVQKVFPIAVRTREDGSLAVDYEKLGILAFAAIKELDEKIKKLMAG